jgi:hypothetical protein
MRPFGRQPPRDVLRLLLIAFLIMVQLAVVFGIADAPVVDGTAPTSGVTPLPGAGSPPPSP